LARSSRVMAMARPPPAVSCKLCASGGTAGVSSSAGREFARRGRWLDDDAVPRREEACSGDPGAAPQPHADGDVGEPKGAGAANDAAPAGPKRDEMPCASGDGLRDGRNDGLLDSLRTPGVDEPEQPGHRAPEVVPPPGSAAEAPRALVSECGGRHGRRR
jgi:hypothetical protein